MLLIRGRGPVLHSDHGSSSNGQVSATVLPHLSAAAWDDRRYGQDVEGRAE